MIIDNVNSLLGNELRKNLGKNIKLKIIASTFSIYAFEELKKELGNVESLEFIFSSPTFTKGDISGLKSKEKREFHIPKLNRERDVYGNEFEIHLRNKLNQKAIAKECAEWVKSRVTFKSNKSNAPVVPFLHITKPNSENIVYQGMRGFTMADLGYQKSNAHFTSIIPVQDFQMTHQLAEQFDGLWVDSEKLEDVTDAITDHILSVYKENSPEYVYFLTLYNIFNEFLEDINEDILPDDNVGYKDSLIWNKLFDFQKDGVSGIISKMEKYNGCILADSVGLGKTFSALAVIKYYQQRNKSILVLCPKKLAENWLQYKGNTVTNILYEDRFNYDVLHHTDLSRDGGVSNGINLDLVNWGNYDVVVIDESHNFRNDEIIPKRDTRYQKLMRDIIQSNVKTKVLMLSATPVNNKFNDLKSQIQLAYEGDSSNLSENLKVSRSIEDIFRRAQKVFNDWEKLPPNERTSESILKRLDFDFFEVLDAVTISRSRKHIEKYYDISEIGGFPERLVPISERPALTKDESIIDYNHIFIELSKLNLSSYSPFSYIQPSKFKKYEKLYDEIVGDGDGSKTLSPETREHGIRAIMTTLLLKRLESSVHAFKITLKHVLQNYQKNIQAIDNFIENGQNISTEERMGFESIESEDDEYDDSFAIGSKIKVDIADMDYISWKADLEIDFSILDALLAAISKITPDKDEKLQNLIRLISNKVENPINAGNKKAIIFSAFSDTAEYLNKHLAPVLQEKYNLNTALLTGQIDKNNSGKPADFHKILTLFSPASKSKDKVYPEDTTSIDILIATDCISEGQNLQDCDYLINYDIHWNPVRIIQRFGRIDRIGSINKQIQLVNYWPDITLDEYINLKERVENKMVAVDMTATGDDNVLSPNTTDASYRKEQLERLQNEVIDLEDIKTGISITDLGLNDFRMDLLNYIKEHPELESAPKGMHAVLAAQPSEGLNPGAIYIMRNVHNTVNINSENRLHPYYMIYIGDDGNVIINHADVKSTLDIMRKFCKRCPAPDRLACTSFNKVTDDGKNMSKYSDLLSQSIASIIDIKEESEVDSLFSGGETVALQNTIQGLDDFELIAFIVIQAA